MFRFRWLARLVAFFRMSWWAPCPICGEHCAEFEQAKEAPDTHVPAEWWDEQDYHAYACRKAACIIEAQRLNLRQKLREDKAARAWADTVGFDEIMRTGGGHYL